ncbi:acyltransferase family protein [Acetobacter senegalensis]|uniref:acyltransferase family protein n=1 Tax=Acetobacter senegalensis TaxID=446692 RepID=UPI00264BBF3C|nr:acyltransferase [Acetobacter senegalensis]MDN7355892.1 acyltransferase [Acetobacter senegalensis]
MPENTVRPTERNAGIDLLRGLSILIVVCHHLSIRIPLEQTLASYCLPPPVLRLFAYGGGNAVTMFFVISGFLITTRSYQTFGGLKDMKAFPFLAHRAARILPCLFALLLILSVLSQIGPQWFHFTDAGQTLGGAILSVLTCTFNWYEGQTTWAPPNWDVLWSLSIEEAFYLGFPALCLLPSMLRLFLLVALVLLGPLDQAALPHSNPVWRSKAYLPGFGAIATGVLSAMLCRKLSFSPVAGWTVTLAGACFALLELCAGPALWEIVGSWYVVFLTGGVALMLIGLTHVARSGHSTAPRWGTGWLQSFGRLSYEIYLTHMFVVMPAVTLFTAAGGTAEGLGLALYPAVVGASWGLGAVVARFWSRPAARWLDQRWKNSLQAIPHKPPCVSPP